ncbi:MAG: glycoside hydrolase family 127 protein, partial [Bifidobacteriaceae bacterium]|nr:glycoside hydrolase family 127 protein [Bifidobacteriaceae bacterium]
MKPTELLEEEVSRRSVLVGAAAIGGTMVAAHFLGKSVTSAEAAGNATASTQAAGAAPEAHQVAPIAATESAAIPEERALPGWKVQSFPLGDVEITGGVFSRARDGMLAFAKAYPIDRMLACFRTNAGLDDGGAEPAGGWENYPKGSVDLARKQSWGPREYKRGQNKDTADGLLRGHYAGHFLSMLGQAYAESKDSGILKKINEICAGLKECREALAVQEYEGEPRYSHPGFLAAYGEWQFSALEEYAPYGEIWAPWYTEHKILAGLISCYQYAGNKDALDLAEGIGHWTYSRLSKCKPEQLQKMWDIYIGGEYGGMNESLIDLYSMSDDPDKEEFLKASKFFNTNKLLTNCAAGNDILNDLHANQHIPQFVGYAKEAALGEKDADYLRATEGFWGMIVPGRMYAHGGTGEGELWGPAHTVAGDIGERNAESCAAYNMLKVSRFLFFIEQKPKYMDYYERTLLNHILGGKSRDIDSAAELSPGNCYMYPVNPATQKEYGDGNVGTCCGGTALESHSKYQDSIYFHSVDDAELYVNLYVPSTLKWETAGFELVQETNYPEEGTSKLTVK